MRRLRPQFKPNLGPRPAARPGDSRPKPASAAPPLSAPPCDPDTTDGTQLFQIKCTDSKLPEATSAVCATVSNPPESDPPVVSPTLGDRLLSDQPKFSPGSRSPKNAAAVNHPKSPVKGKRINSGVAENSPSISHASSSHSDIQSSPQPGQSQDSAASEVHEKLSSPSSRATDTQDTEKSSVFDAKSKGGGSVKPSNVKPAVIRSARARFKPNFGDASKRKQQPAAVEKKVLEAVAETKAKDQDADPQQPRVCDAGVEDEPSVPEVSTSVSASREPTEEEKETDSPASVPDPPALVNKDVVQDTDAMQQSESSLGSAEDSSLLSAPDLPSEEPSSQSQQPGVGEDLAHRKNPPEKKIKRVKPSSLPSLEKPVDRSKMKMSDLIYWNPKGNPMTKRESRTVLINTPPATPAHSTAGEEDEEEEDEVPIIQLKLDANNQIILSDQSMTMKEEESKNVPTEIVEEDEDRFITCQSFQNNERSKRWSQTETARFFHALSYTGTDFSLMRNMFPSRSRRDLKNKFRKEDKRNPHLIDKALRGKRILDEASFEKAQAADAAEKRQQEAVEEEKKKKKMKKEQRELERQKEEEEEEEEAEKDMEADLNEELKENNLKRKRDKLCKDDGKFPGYKRGRTDTTNAGLTQEVVEILVNMRRGSGSAADKHSTTTLPAKRTIAANQPVSAPSAPTINRASRSPTPHNSPFIPRLARAMPPAHPPSTSNVLVDREVGEFVVLEEGRSESMAVHTPLGTGDVPGLQRGPVSTLTQPPSSWTGSDQASTSLPPPSQSSGADLPTSAVATIDARNGQEVVLEGESLNQMDLLLVEQQIEGQEQVIHVYVVPRQTLDPNFAPNNAQDHNTQPVSAAENAWMQMAGLELGSTVRSGESHVDSLTLSGTDAQNDGQCLPDDGASLVSITQSGAQSLSGDALSCISLTQNGGQSLSGNNLSCNLLTQNGVQSLPGDTLHTQSQGQSLQGESETLGPNTYAESQGLGIPSQSCPKQDLVNILQSCTRTDNDTDHSIYSRFDSDSHKLSHHTHTDSEVLNMPLNTQRAGHRSHLHTDHDVHSSSSNSLTHCGQDLYTQTVTDDSAANSLSSVSAGLNKMGVWTLGDIQNSQLEGGSGKSLLTVVGDDMVTMKDPPLNTKVRHGAGTQDGTDVGENDVVIIKNDPSKTGSKSSKYLYSAKFV